MNRTITTCSLALAAAAALLAQNPSLGDILKGGVKKGGQTQPAPAPSKPATPAETAPRTMAPARAATATAPATGTGYRINLPAGWRSELTPNQAVVARSGDGSGIVVIAPVMAPGGMTPQDYLQRFLAMGVRSWFPEAAVVSVAPSRLGRSGALASVRFRSAVGPGQASALLFLGGGVGTLYMIGAPAASFAQMRPALIGILRSFSFDGQGGSPEGRPSGAAASVQLSYTRFSDPYENSFSCDVPAGWSVKGGLVRKSTVDVRGFVRLSSPGGVSVFVGDPEIGTFVTPTETLAMTGFREGSAYSPGYGNVMIVSRYVPGLQFAQNYASRIAASMGVSNLRARDARQRPDLSGGQNGMAQEAWTAGEISFEGVRDGRPVAGYVLAATKLTSMYGSGIWNVTTLVGYIAPAGQAAVPTAVIGRMMQTFRLNPQWFGQQQATTAQTSAIVTETNNRVSQIINDTYWSRQRAQDRASENFSDYIRGRVRLKDPDTGEELEGRAGNNYYWRVRGTNTIIGADTPNPPPTIDVTELEQVR